MCVVQCVLRVVFCLLRGACCGWRGMRVAQCVLRVACFVFCAMRVVCRVLIVACGVGCVPRFDWHDGGLWPVDHCYSVDVFVCHILHASSIAYWVGHL